MHELMGEEVDWDLPSLQLEYDPGEQPLPDQLSPVRQHTIWNQPPPPPPPPPPGQHFLAAGPVLRPALHPAARVPIGHGHVPAERHAGHRQAHPPQPVQHAYAECIEAYPPQLSPPEAAGQRWASSAGASSARHTAPTGWAVSHRPPPMTNSVPALPFVKVYPVPSCHGQLYSQPAHGRGRHPAGPSSSSQPDPGYASGHYDAMATPCQSPIPAGYFGGAFSPDRCDAPCASPRGSSQYHSQCGGSPARGEQYEGGHGTEEQQCGLDSVARQSHRSQGGVHKSHTSQGGQAGRQCGHGAQYSSSQSEMYEVDHSWQYGQNQDGQCGGEMQYGGSSGGLYGGSQPGQFGGNEGRQSSGGHGGQCDGEGGHTATAGQHHEHQHGGRQPEGGKYRGDAMAMQEQYTSDAVAMQGQYTGSYAEEDRRCGHGQAAKAVGYSPGHSSVAHSGIQKKTALSSSAPRPPGRARKAPWTRTEDQMIRDGVVHRGYKWTSIAQSLPRGRSADAVRNRWHRLMTKAGMGRAKAGTARRSTAAAAYGEETEGEEDGLAGSDGSSGETVEAECDGGLTLPEEKHGDMWTEDEDEVIDRAVDEQGPAWRNIALLLPGRTHSGCRNRWVRLQERRLAQAGLHVTGATGVMDVLRRIGVSWVPNRPVTAPTFPAQLPARAAGSG